MTPEQAREELWHAGILRWKLWPQQLKIYDTVRTLHHDAQTVVVLCARQFGKSVLCCTLALEDCLQNPDVVVLIIGPDLPQVRSIVRPRIKLLMRDAPRTVRKLDADGEPVDVPFCREVKSEDTWYFHNGAELKLGSYTSNATSQRGKTLYKVYLEEFGVDAEPERYLTFLRSDLGPAMTHSKHAQALFFTTPPKIPDHPFMSETVPEAELCGAFFKFTIHDNQKLTKAQKEACARLAGGVDSTDYKREYLCEVVRDERLVLVPEYCDPKHQSVGPFHVEDFDVPTFCHLWVAGDSGGIRDMSVLLLMGYDFDRQKILVVDERVFPAETATPTIVEAGRGVEQLYRPKDARYAVRARYVDAPGQAQIDLSTIFGYPVIAPRKDELEATGHQVRLAFIRHQVVVHERCTFLRTTLRSGTFNEKRTDLARTKALGHMDGFMALAYGIRHADLSNPYPPGHGINHETMHAPYGAGDQGRPSSTAHALKQALRPNRLR